MVDKLTSSDEDIDGYDLVAPWNLSSFAFPPQPTLLCDGTTKEIGPHFILMIPNGFLFTTIMNLITFP